MALFQLLNPKTWLASLAFASGYLAANSPGEGLAIDILGVTAFLFVVFVAASLWTLFGAAFRTRLSPSNWRIANRVLAVLAWATIVSFWV